MKSYIGKLFLGVAFFAGMWLSSCVNDLDQMPKDPNVKTPSDIKNNPQEFLGSIMAKCYSGLAVSGQYGPNGDSDIKGLDGGTSQWSRGIFMLNEFPTDEAMWIYQDAGVPDLVQANWSSDNVIIYGVYSRLYTHIAICNEFLRTTTPDQLAIYGVEVDDELQKNIDQFRLEARALRALSYYYVIDFFGNGVVAWDDIAYGEIPPQTTRKELFDKVVGDLEDVLAAFPDATPVYGRIGKDAVEALLCRYYLNAEVYTDISAYDKCWTHAQNIINRHKGGGFENTGLATDYLSLFCGNNDMFMPGGSLPSQNEILWGIPYDAVYTEPWGGTTFLCFAPVMDAADNALNAGFCDKTWYGHSGAWGCMHARQQFSEHFDFIQGYSPDRRTILWLTENAGYTIANDVYDNFASGYLAIKFTNLICNSDGTMPIWNDENGLTRAGVQPVVSTDIFPNTDLPIIRLADVYLMAAEASLHGAGDRETGRGYINTIRRRAGISELNSVEFNETNVLAERCRELYWEGTRRTDLIRHGKFTGNSYTWNWKNNIPSGGSLASHRNLYPLPSNVTAVYGSSIQQNPGY